MKEMEREQMSQDELKKIRRMSFIKMSAMVGIVVAVLAFSSVAWFTQNREVEGTGMHMTATSDLYSIGAGGNTVGSYDGLYWGKAIQEAGCNGAAVWMLSADSNMRNFQIENLKEDDRGIKPGTYGKISFMFYPNQSLAASFIYRLYAFSVESELDGTEKPETFALQSDETVNALMNGHILLFTQRTGSESSGYQYSGLITARDDLQRISQVQTYQANSSGQDVEIFWVWPETLAQVILPAGNVNLRGRKSIATDEIRNYFQAHPEYFLLNCPDEDVATIKADNADVEEIVDESYAKFSKLYNEADQEIGTKVNYALLDMKIDTTTP